ncbi:MAG: hypothetical protein AAB225_27210 [Acidobacteriota bacterium]
MRYLWRGDSWNVDFTSNAMVYGRFPIRVEFLGAGASLRADREANWILMGVTPGSASTTPCYPSPNSQIGNCYDAWLARWNSKGEPQWLTILGGSAE